MRLYNTDKRYRKQKVRDFFPLNRRNNMLYIVETFATITISSKD